jgi:hypothetical protein
MSSGLPADILETRAEDQRRALHNRVTELRSTLRESLDLKKNAREYLWPAAGVAGFLGLVLGYGFTGIFTAR